jgi:predicted Zn-dependent protease
LAIVLGHEITHAVAGHGRERMSEEMVAQGIEVAGNVALGSNPQTVSIFNSVYGSAAQVGVLLPNSRNQEYEADHYGLIFAAMAGYDPEEAIPFWTRMMNLSAGNAPPVWSSDHPSDASRIEKLKELMPEALKYYKPATPATPSPTPKQ